MFDVFLIDSDFKIERPTRYYRQGLNLLTIPTEGAQHHHGQHLTHHDNRSHAGSFTSRISRVFSRRRDSMHTANGSRAGKGRPSHTSEATMSDDTANSETEEEIPSRPVTPMLDPSTNTNPLEAPDEPEKKGKQGDGHGHKKRKTTGDVSKHTFYVENSQMKLKVYAKNEVRFIYLTLSYSYLINRFQRQMLQWIAALEKVARESHFTGKNRFDSFAPIRLNVAAQWLVDGVSLHSLPRISRGTE